MQGGGEKKGKKGPFGKNSSNHNNAAHRSLAVDTCALRETRRPLPAPPTHTALFFFSSFIDLNSFSASNTRNRPTFSHPLLCGRLIFGHLRSIGDHFWENKAPFQVGGLATRAHLDHQRRSEQGGAAPPLVWAQRVGWGVWSWVHQLIKRKNSSCSTNIGGEMRKVLSVDVGPSNSWGGESR